MPHSEAARAQAHQTTGEVDDLPPRSAMDRLFPYLLLAVTLAAFVPLIVLGMSEFISYDGYWHVFIDKQDRWRIFLSEYRGDAHPILYHLILRVLTRFGHSHLLYRSASILPGAATVYLVGRLAAKLCTNKAIALLAAAAYGFSITIIGINIDVRSYPLALFFVIAACYYLVDFLLRELDRNAARSLVLSSVFTGLAIASEYYAVFYFLPVFALVFFLIVRHPELRRGGLEWSIDHWLTVSTAAALPFLVIAFFYQTHIRYQPPSYGHVSEFYWTRGVSVPEFVLRNLRADLNYLLPFEVTSTALLLALLAVFVPLLSYFCYVGLVGYTSRTRMAAALPAYVLFALFAELIVLSLAGRYPFGGYERQQSIVFPFVILAVFILLDWLLSFVRVRVLNAAVLILAGAAIALSFSYQWGKYPHRTEELFTAEYNILRAKIPSSDPLYLDQFTLIGFYIHTHDWTWKFGRHFREPDRVDQYDIAAPSGQHSVLLRDIDQWNFDLAKPGVYQVFARALHDAQLGTASIFLLKQVTGHMDAAGIAAEENTVRSLASAAGLEVLSIYDDNDQSEIRFRVVK